MDESIRQVHSNKQDFYFCFSLLFLLIAFRFDLQGLRQFRRMKGFHSILARIVEHTATVFLLNADPPYHQCMYMFSLASVGIHVLRSFNSLCWQETLAPAAEPPLRD